GGLKNKIITDLTEEKAGLETALSKTEEMSQDNLERLKNNEIDIGTLKIGDKLPNGMAVASVAPAGEESGVADHWRAVFKGKAVISGEYFYTKDGNPLTDGQVCFKPDEESEKVLPKINGAGIENRNGVLCFSNQETTKLRYGPLGSRGQATIVIDNFELSASPAGNFSAAELIKTIEKK
ncbi:MAG: hypothetical protein HY984_01550, partial [Candidatus Magasanikbacteria bacterium]|nr:hypothetical protein [Candidatus Magasanikbacteria bacterium]